MERRYDIYDKVVYVRYDPDDNIYYDECGFRIDNIFEMLTPNDVYMFAQDPGYNTFPLRNHVHTLCEILVETEEEMTDFYDCTLADSPCQFWSGRLCKFYGVEEASVKDICQSCGGR